MINPFATLAEWPDNSGVATAHPERPWWVWMPKFTEPVWSQQGRWVHPDGTYFVGPMDDPQSDALAAYDDAHPRPTPPALVGQVWAGSTWTRMIDRLDSAGRPVEPAEDPAHLPGVQLAVIWATWPPTPDAVLIAGPGAPWAPTGWTPPQSSNPSI